MASSISSSGNLEDFQGKNQDAASFNWFATAPVYCVHGSSLSHPFNAATDVVSFCRLLCIAHGTGWFIPWSQNADIDMDQRDCAY